MNWTESSLNRYSRRKGWNRDQARQKQSFAKARTKTNSIALAKSSDPRTVPFIPSYIPQPAIEKRTTEETLRTRLVGSKRSSKRHLAQLSSEPVCEQEQPLAASSLLGNRKDSTEVRDPLNRGEPVDLNAKRRKLLRQSDWTGIEFQKPIVVDYDQSNREARPKHDLEMKKHSHGLEKYVFSGGRSPGYKPEHHRKAAQSPDVPMRLRVGSESLQWSRDNNTVRTTGPRRGQPTTMFDWESSEPYSSPHLPTLPPHPATSSCQEDWTGTPDNRSSGSGATPRQPTAPELPHLREPVEKPHYVVKSMPKLHHPRPSRHQKSLVIDFIPGVARVTSVEPRVRGEASLRLAMRPPAIGLASADPEAARSTVAQVGCGREPQHGETRENRRWRSWLDITCARGLDGHAEGKDGEEACSVTPGVSQV